MSERNNHAYLFPGHGSQRVGMGHELYEQSPAANRIFRRADKILGYPLSEICFFDPKNQLTGDKSDTSVIQPALLTVSYATAIALNEQRIPPAVLHLGHSVGKYAALVAGGSLEFAPALSFINERGRRMKESQNLGVVVGMVIGLGSERIQEELKKLGEKAESFRLTVDNTRTLAMIGGLVDQWGTVSASLKDAGAQIVKLYTGAPLSHHPLMSEIQAKLNLIKLRLRDADIPTLDDLSNILMTKAQEAEDSVLDHLIRPISWRANINKLQEMGIPCAVEVGPGNVLSGMMKREYPGIQTYQTDTWNDILNVKNNLGSNG